MILYLGEKVVSIELSESEVHKEIDEVCQCKNERKCPRRIRLESRDGILEHLLQPCKLK